jgi:hypothetical protein
MPFFSSFTGSFAGGRRIPIGVGGGGGGALATFDADLLNVDAGVTNVSTPYVYLSPDGSTAVFAESRWDSSSGLGEDWGRIHIFSSTGGSWQFVQSMFPPSSAQTNGYTLYRTYFGEGVALSNDGSRIAVNGPNHGNTGSNATQYGAIWILDRQGDGTYSEAYRISRSRSSNWNAERGISITPDGNTISLASWNDGSSATDYVMADVYGYNAGTDTWDKQAGTTAFSRNVSLRSAGQNQYFGEGYSKLSEDGRYCLFFAEEAWHFSTAGGYAAVGYWNGNTWVRQAELNPGSVTRYGASGDINGDGSVLVVSDNDRPATNAGQIHIWRRSGSTWTKEQTIVNPTSNANSYTRRFGQNVRMNSAGTSIAVLAAQSGEGETATIYFYDYDAGTQTWSASSQGDIDTGFTDAFYGSLTYTDLIMDATKDLGLIVLGDTVRNTLQFYERPGGGFGGTAPSSPAWDPSTDITAAIWFDASDTSSYTLSGSNVTAVTDKAGNATVTVNGTPNTSNTLDSKNVFTFSGSGEDFTTDEVAQASSGNHWAIGVMQWNSRNDSQDSFWSTENNSGSILNKRDYAISAGASGFDGELDLDGLVSNRISSTIGNKQDFDSGIAQNTWVILVAIFNKTGNQIAVRVDGDNAFTPVNDYDNSLDTLMDLRIFRNRANERMGGRMAEFFTVADVPGTGGTDITDVQKAEGYLAHKWGLEGSLPNDHPYKGYAP